METIALGGVWADWHARVTSAEARAEEAEQLEYLTRIRCEEAEAGLAEMQEAHRSLAHSLTSLSLADKDNQEIVEIIKQEKLNLEKRTAGLEAAREWQEKQVAQLKERVVALEEECKGWIERVDKDMEESDCQKKAILALQQKLTKSGHREEALMKQVEQLQAQVETLNHSGNTKSRQLQVLCKERDRLKSELATAPSTNKADHASSGFTPHTHERRASKVVSPATANPVTPCKHRASPVSVASISISSPASPAPGARRQQGSPVPSDPYTWLLDSRPQAQSSPTAATASSGVSRDNRDLASILRRIAQE